MTPAGPLAPPPYERPADACPVLSIVVPAFNKSGTLPRLFHSLLTDPVFRNTIEIIVVDDASRDETAQVAAEWAQRVPAISLIRHAANAGVHAARNTGMAAARGAWVAFVDADDYLLPDGLARILDSLKAADGYDVMFFGYVTDGGEPTGFARAGRHECDEVMSGEAFRSEKNCLLCVRLQVVRDYGLTWYHTNLDSLFWREAVYRARGQSAYVIEPAVGVYDTTTVGSLKKLRRDDAHRRRHASHKLAAVLRFLGRVEPYLVTAPGPARAVVSLLLLDNLKYAPSKWRYAFTLVKRLWRLPIGAGLRAKVFVALVFPSHPAWWRWRDAGAID
jgi:glycosyltransferase involved in cell wall biosynthesis